MKTKPYTVYTVKEIRKSWEWSSSSLDSAYLDREAAEHEMRRLQAHADAERNAKIAKGKDSGPNVEYVIEPVTVYP